jgi:hypothetical protein
MASGPVTLDMQIAEDPRIGIVCVLRLNSTASLVIHSGEDDVQSRKNSAF